MPDTYLVLSYLIATVSICINFNGFFFRKWCPWSDPLTILIYLSNHGNLNLWEELFGTFWSVHNNIKSYLCQVVFLCILHLRSRWEPVIKDVGNFSWIFDSPISQQCFMPICRQMFDPSHPLCIEMSFTQKFSGKYVHVKLKIELIFIRFCYFLIPLLTPS